MGKYMDGYVLPERAWERRDEPEVREELIVAHMVLVRAVVGKLFRKQLPCHVDEDDLISFGTIGLIKAVENFDHRHGSAFDSYAIATIRGAILDELRQLDWAPRSLRKRQREMTRAEDELKNEKGQQPTDPEVAERLSWTTDDVSSTRREVETSWPKSLDELNGSIQRDMHEIVPDEGQSGADHHRGSHEHDRSSLVMEQMAQYIAGLPAQERAVVTFCYYLEMKQSEVAQALGIPESRVSTVHSTVMEALRDRMEELLLVTEG